MIYQNCSPLTGSGESGGGGVGNVSLHQHKKKYFVIDVL